MHLFENFTKYQKNIHFRKSAEFLYFMNNKHLFSDIEMYRFLYDAKESFDVIRANIIIQAIKNKMLLDKSITYAFKESSLKTDDVPEFIRNKLIGMPYMKDIDLKIYVPIFSRFINTFYSGQYGKILTSPHSKLLNSYQTSCIDLFEMYNFDLYDSLFTKLITIYRDKKVLIAYHFDFKTVYIINDQGRLDAKISLFDKYLKKINNNHIIDRLKPVIDMYLKGDRDGMCKELVKNEFISEKLIFKILKSENKLVKNNLEHL